MQKSLSSFLRKAVVWIAVILVALPPFVSAQPSPDSLWVKTYPGVGNNWFADIQQTTDGGYIAVGIVNYTGWGVLTADFWLVKLDVSGDTLWEKTFGGTGYDEARRVRQTTDGGYIVCGMSMSEGNTGLNAMVIKTNANGDSLWSYTYSGATANNAIDFFRDVKQTSDGGYVLAGGTAHPVEGYRLNYLLVKLDANGSEQWWQRWSGSWNEHYLTGVEQMSDGGYIVVGAHQYCGVTNCTNVYIGRCDALGNLQYYNWPGVGYIDIPYEIKTLPSGDFIVACESEMNDHPGPSDFSLLKICSDAYTVAWFNHYGTSEDEHALSVAVAPDGGFMLTGYGTIGSPWYDRAIIMKIDSGGTWQWERRTASNGWGTAQCGIFTNDDGYLICGSTAPTNSGPLDAFLWKTGPEAIKPNPDIAWTKLLGTNDNDEARYVEPTADGGYIVAGTLSQSDLYLMRLSGGGDTLWTLPYGGGSADFAYCVQQTVDGGFAVGGLTNSFGAGSDDGYLVKTDSSGAQEWARTYGGSGNDAIYCLRQTHDGGFILAGSTSSLGEGTPSHSNMFVVRTNDQGDTLWTRLFGAGGDEVARSVRQTSDHGFILAGYSTSYGAGGQDFYIIKLDSLGGLQWDSTYGGLYNDESQDIEQTVNGDYAIVGTTYSYGTGAPTYPNIYSIIVDGQGHIKYTNAYASTYSEYGHSIQQTTDEGFVISGYRYKADSRLTDGVLYKTNNRGENLWLLPFGGTGHDYLYCGRQTEDGGYILVGKSNSFGSSNDQIYIVKTGPTPFAVSQVFGVNAGEQSCENVSILWSPVSDATLYKVYRNERMVGIVNASMTNLVDIPGAGSYDYRVKAFYNSVGGPWSFPDAGTRLTIPPLVTDIQASDTGCIGIAINWTDTPNETGYYIWRNWERIDSVAANVTHFEDNSAVGTYAYGIQSYNTCGEVTDTIYWDWGTRRLIPLQVTGVAASDTSCSFVQITWNDLGNEDGYRIYRNGTMIASMARDSTRYQDNPAVGTYNYTVKAYNTCGDSPISVSDAGSRADNTPAAPQIVILREGTSARLRWNPVQYSLGGCAIDVTGYLVFYADHEGGPYLYHGFTSDTTYIHRYVMQFATGMFYHVQAFTGMVSLLVQIPDNTPFEEVCTRLDLLSIPNTLRKDDQPTGYKIESRVN